MKEAAVHDSINWSNMNCLPRAMASKADGTSKMKHAQLAQIAEIVAAAAVVVSLVYVGQEVQSNTAAVRGAAMRAVASSDGATIMTVAADEGLSEIVRVGLENPSELTSAEAFRYQWFMRQFWLSFQNIYQQSKLELIDQSVWESYLSVVCGLWANPGTRETWSDHDTILESDFVAVVQTCEVPK